MKLYTYPGNFRAFKILIAAEYNGTDIEIPDFKMGTDNVTPEFLAKSPMGKVPLLETSQGCIFESNAIARYVAQLRRDTELMGTSFFEAGQVDSWIDWCTHELELPATMWFYPVLGYMPYNAMATEKARGDLAKALGVLEAYLLDKTYLVGEKVTLADIHVASALIYPFKLVCGPAYRNAFPCVMRWFNTCVNQPEFIAVCGTVVLAETELVAQGGSAAAAPASGAQTGGKKKKEKKGKGGGDQAKQQKKKEKKAAPKQQEEKKEKPKKPAHIVALETLDKKSRSSMSMDGWKREYSNCATYDEGMDAFWAMFDSEGFSLWEQEYQYNSDNTKLFMTSNLCSGFLQRTGEIRKWAFGTCVITGNDENSEGGPDMNVSGMWLIRGQEITPMLEANPDAEYHTWTKIDNTSDPEVRQRVKEYWTRDCGEQIKGRTVLDSKVFK
eukprot:CAMPEP_0118886972 /NCGR_PEP_ID=MMETSP1163-20130328/24854_1 /TAXON_ID=124430 /ORGANISM="Phaeomonas parva, Strain CCMP2877" /LENGTH=440 /DNA_ID=CAMNT_0006825307 /DNA_START=26 /DNA_END=1348 /DNA_ORIENTATION=-